MDGVSGAERNTVFRLVIEGEMIGNVIALCHCGIAMLAPQQSHMFQGTEIFSDRDFGNVESLCQLRDSDSFPFVDDIQKFRMANMQSDHLPIRRIFFHKKSIT